MRKSSLFHVLPAVLTAALALCLFPAAIVSAAPDLHLDPFTIDLTSGKTVTVIESPYTEEQGLAAASVLRAAEETDHSISSSSDSGDSGLYDLLYDLDKDGHSDLGYFAESGYIYLTRLPESNLRGSYKLTLSSAAKAGITDSYYADSVTFKLTIPLKKDQLKVSGLSALTYTGKALKPKITVKLGGKTLKEKTDYTLTYKNNRAVGKASVIIKGCGSTSGTVTKSFKILPRGTRITKLSKSGRVMTVQWKIQSTRMPASRITGYHIQYSTKAGLKSGIKNIYVKSYAKTLRKIRNLALNKKYYVRIRTYKTVKGCRFFSKWSSIKSVR